MPLATSTVLGHFEILEPLAKGGMGEVYLARDQRLGRNVALKVLPAHLLENARAVDRFAREARAASALNHPNIITVFDIGDTAAAPFIAMELVLGETLDRAVVAEKTLSGILELFRQCAAALVAAHEAGIVHRDIKPDNIMVRSDGYVKVLDFGLARLTSPEHPALPSSGNAGFTGSTQAGFVVGTLRYLSPEQAVGEAITTASDIFSLGTVMYELLTGEHPFSQGSEVATLAAIVTRTPPEPASIKASLPHSVASLVQRSLAKDASARPTAAELVELLKRAILSAERRAAWEHAVGSTEVTAYPPSRDDTMPDVTPVLKRSITVGRAQDIARLLERYHTAARGEGHLLALTGEPGIGKTTLVDSVLAQCAVSAPAPLIARGRCSERLAGAEAYLPVLEALDDAMRSGDRSTARQFIERFAPTWASMLATASQPEADDAPEIARTVGASQERLKREMGALLTELSRLRPVVLFIDDVHWADVSTVDLLAYLGTRLDGLAVLIVVTYRDEEMRATKHPFLQVQRELQARGAATEVAIEFLTVDAVREYLRVAYANHEFPASLAAALHARTEGNPLFLVDVLRWLGTQGVIAEESGHWRLVRSLAELDRELPESVRSMIERKIEQLGDAERKLLAAAAVQGAEFDSAIAAKVLGEDVADVEEQLMVLDRVYAFVRHAGEKRWPDRSVSVQYRFVHALYQNALLAGLAPSRRAGWSATVAEALERRFGESAGEVAADLAVLHETARAHDRAAQWFAVASGNARDLHGYAESASLAERGLRQVEAMEPGAEQLVRELELRLALGVASLVRRGYAAPETALNMRRARELCAALGDAPALSSALWVLLLFNIAQGELAQAEPIAAHLLTSAEQTDDAELRIAAHSCYIGLLTHMGRFHEALSHREALDRLLTPALQRGVRRRFLPEPVIMSRAEQLRSLVLLGEVERAAAIREIALAEADASAHPQDQAFVAHFVAEYELMYGDAAIAEQAALAAVALCEEYGIASERLWAMMYVGAAKARRGAFEEGIAQMRLVIQTLQAIGCRIVLPGFHGLLGEALLQSGNADAALEALHTGLEIGRTTGEHAFDAELWRVIAVAQDRRAADGVAEASTLAASAWNSAIGAAESLGATRFLERIAQSRGA